MTLSSSFTDFSLAELFQLVDQGRKSGCLTICTLPDLHAPGSKSHYYYIWFRQGRVVAATNRLNGQGLRGKIIQRGWASQQVFEQVCPEASSISPLGLLLKTHGVLSAEQLNLLFANQLQQVRNLFEIQKGVFKLDSKAALPLQEMTGLSLRTIEVALMAVRALKNWKVLSDVLPDANSGIKSVIHSKPQVHLHNIEWQVWEFANGSVSLSAIASQLNQPVAVIQQAAFRLKLAGLVEEIPLIESSLDLNDNYIGGDLENNPGVLRQKYKDPEPHKISASFLHNLVGFLRSKA